MVATGLRYLYLVYIITNGFVSQENFKFSMVLRFHLPHLHLFLKRVPGNEGGLSIGCGNTDERALLPLQLSIVAYYWCLTTPMVRYYWNSCQKPLTLSAMEYALKFPCNSRLLLYFSVMLAFPFDEEHMVSTLLHQMPNNVSNMPLFHF